jgi:glyoxylase-like metal-dependent hydrolase (beta-lactamase superfamily II)
MGIYARFFGGGSIIQVAPDVFCLQDRIVNIYFIGKPFAGDKKWVLVDTGLFGAASRIRNAAGRHFGLGARPSSIILTHGHFDHVGAVIELASEWNIPVYAHPLELPYLNGNSDYPPPDPGIKGAMSRLSFLYPRKPINVGEHLHALPVEGIVPALHDWQWIHTPGHSAGHISLYRRNDGLLIAGDAFVTTKQESAYYALTQKKVIHRPPAYFTSDWDAARESVKKLALLKPEIAATGHGLPMKGSEMQMQLENLAANFKKVAIPRNGKYVLHPVRG